MSSLTHDCTRCGKPAELPMEGCGSFKGVDINQIYLCRKCAYMCMSGHPNFFSSKWVGIPDKNKEAQ